MTLIEVNSFYGTPENPFIQAHTVETVFLDSNCGGIHHEDPLGIDGSFAIGMLSTIEDDLLGLAFDTEDTTFLNICMDAAVVALC